MSIYYTNVIFMFVKNFTKKIDLQHNKRYIVIFRKKLCLISLNIIQYIINHKKNISPDFRSVNIAIKNWKKIN